jgi:hypothetical protein
MCLVTEHVNALKRVKELEEALASAHATIEPSASISINEMSSIILDKLEEIGDTRAELYLADLECRVYNKDEVEKFLKIEQVDKIVYQPSISDCDDFAAVLFGKGMGLVWTTVHALNWFVDTDLKLWFIEPQTDSMSESLEGWQGWDIRCFISR